jgi:hypothetical protein
MATDRKHIAVYLAPEVEQALIAFCQEKGLISKKGTMYSAGVNAALAQFFGLADINNILQPSSNIPPKPSNIPSSQPSTTPSTIPSEILPVEAVPGK